jgi:hypothetical protein
MKYKLLILFLFFIQIELKAQFGYAYGNSGYNYGASVCLTKADSGFFLLGSSSWYSNGNLDFFLLKSDSLGKIKWARNYGGNSIEKACDILNYNDSVYYLTGFTNDNSTGDYNIKIVKINQTGDVLFNKQIGSDSWDFSSKSILTPDSTILIVGQSYKRQNYNGDAYLLKLNLKGDTIKTNFWGDSTENKFNYIHYTNRIITSSGFTSTMQNVKKALLVKYDDELNPIDTFIFQHNFDSEFYSAKIIKDKKTLALGYIKSSNQNLIHGFICLLDSNYNLLWVDSTSNNGDEFWRDIITLSNNDIVITGGTKLYGNGGYGYYDINTIHFNEGLGFKSSKTFGGVYEDTPSQLISINDSIMAIIGNTNNFGPSYNHIFFLKFNLNNYFINPESFLIGNMENDDLLYAAYPNPTNDFIKIKGLIENTTVKVLNLNGQLIYSEIISPENPFFSLKNFSKGCYIFELNLRNKQKHFKIFKE